MGDDEFVDMLSTARGRPADLAARQLVASRAAEPGVLGELGLTALQAWQRLSERQDRGRGKVDVAILFTDLVGFSSWALEAGDRQAVRLLRDFSKAVEPPILERRGEVVKRLGDGLMGAFWDARQRGRGGLRRPRADGADRGRRVPAAAAHRHPHRQAAQARRRLLRRRRQHRRPARRGGQARRDPRLRLDPGGDRPDHGHRQEPSLPRQGRAGGPRRPRDQAPPRVRREPAQPASCSCSASTRSPAPSSSSRKRLRSRPPA